MFGHWQDSHNIYILMPYAAGGELLHLIHDQETLGEGAYLQTCLHRILVKSKSVLAYMRVLTMTFGWRGNCQKKLEGQRGSNEPFVFVYAWFWLHHTRPDIHDMTTH